MNPIKWRREYQVAWILLIAIGWILGVLFAWLMHVLEYWPWPALFALIFALSFYVFRLIASAQELDAVAGLVMREDGSVTIYVQLLEEGTATIRPTQAVPLGKGLYKLLPTPHYDPEDEIWEFLPNSIIKCKKIGKKEPLFLAVEKIG